VECINKQQGVIDMKKLVLKVFLVGLSIAAIVGCGVQPVYNVDEAAIVSSMDKPIKLDDVKKAIIRGGSSLGWQMKEAEPGHIVGTLFLRKHMAQVDITYSTKSYSITYKDSKELNYDGTNIHSNYNGWIQNLQRNIDVQISTL